MDKSLTREEHTMIGGRLAVRRRPEYRELTQVWMRSRLLLEQHFDLDTVRQLAAPIEGLTLHRALDGAPHGRDLTSAAVTRITTAP